MIDQQFALLVVHLALATARVLSENHGVVAFGYLADREQICACLRHAQNIVNHNIYAVDSFTYGWH